MDLDGIRWGWKVRFAVGLESCGVAGLSEREGGRQKHSRSRR